MSSDKPVLLAIDTATEACSAALLKNGTITARYEIAPRRHNILIFEMIREVLAKTDTQISDINAIAFGRGPGSFTGVRIAASLAQSIAYVHHLPLIPVSNLQIVAQIGLDANTTDAVCVAMDARMEEIYCAYYERAPDGLAKLLTEEQVIPPTELEVPQGFQGISVGSGWKSAKTELESVLKDHITSYDPEILPNAETMIKLALPRLQSGEIVSPNQGIPNYLRNPFSK